MAALGFATACASAGRVVPPTNQNITSGLALADLPESAGDVWVDNRSSVPITVLAVTLHDCRNVQQECGARIPLSARVEPDSREIVYHVVRKVPYEWYRVAFATEWRPDTSAKPVPGAH